MKKNITKQVQRLFILTCLSLFAITIAKADLYPVDINKISEKAEKVYVGVYLMNIYDINMSANSYYADFYLWCKWKGKINPLTNIEFVNYVEKWGFTKHSIYDTTQILSDGFNYNILRVEGRFYHPFLLKDFPLDIQKLDIQIENSEYTNLQLVYLPAENESGFRPELKIPGWSIGGSTINSFNNKYNTSFGMPNIDKEEYSNLTYNLEIVRPFSFFFWKLLLPLIVVLLSSLGTMLIFPGFIDARISLPIGALLAAVFLQQSYTANLPDVGYMVLMDKIYVLSYMLIIANLIQSIITANRVSNEEEEDYKKVKKIDLRYVISSSIIFILLIVAIIIFN